MELVCACLGYLWEYGMQRKDVPMSNRKVTVLLKIAPQDSDEDLPEQRGL